MFRAGKPVPSPDEGAPGPLTEKQRMDRMVIGGDELSAEEMRRLSNITLDPVPGQEIGTRKVERKKETYKKRLASGGYTKAADGCAQRGKTRGKFV